MWARYLTTVVCFSQTISVLQAHLIPPNRWVNRFTQRKCIPTAVRATCQMIQDPSAPFTVSGTVEFTQINYCGRYGSLYVNVTLEGFTESTRIERRGFHVHELGDLSDGCTSTGGHYNPLDMNHGAPWDKVRHVGDLGNVPVRTDGTVAHLLKDQMASLFGRYSILGRAVVVHAGTDDLGRGGTADSKTTGNAGSKLACCVIGRKT